MKSRSFFFLRSALLLVLAFAYSVPAAAADPPPKRAVPDYDGRGGEPTTAGDVLLWPPRVAMAPFYFVSEFLIRRPLAVLVPAAERADLPGFLYEVFTFGPDHNAGIAPITLIDFGFRLQFGLYAFWDHALAEWNHMHAHASTGGTDYLAVAFTDRVALTPNKTVALRLSGIHRPDNAFYGTGPSSRERDQSRYGANTFEGRVLFDLALAESLHLQASTGLRVKNFYRGHYERDPDIQVSIAAGRFAQPDGALRGYTAAYNHLSLAFDNRKVRPDPASGMRLELEGEQGNDLRTGSASWVRYGATAGGFVDVHNGRVVSLSLTTQWSDSIGPGPIPFTELPSLGGVAPMRGFRPGRLVDRSLIAATVRYRWPIWAKFDGSVQVSAGNVFGDHLRDFKPNLLRLSTALGIETVAAADSSFELLVGAGSETFATGASIDSVRLVFGTNHGF